MEDRGLARRVAFTGLGGTLVVLGTALLVLPGPGILLILAGVVILAKEYIWAQRLVRPIQTRAVAAAHASVATPLRLAWSVLAALAPIGVGVLWIVVPDLPMGGLGTGSSLILAGLVAMVLLLYSRRHRHATPGARNQRHDALQGIRGADRPGSSTDEP